MLTESILASIESSVNSKTALASTLPIIKDAGIFNISLRPHFNPTTTFKKSSARPNAVAVTNTHVFAAQADKAVVHVYAKEKGNQELTVPFGERVTSLAAAGEGGAWVICGLESGGVLVWETHTGRLVKAHQSHLQAVTTIAVDQSSKYFLTGSADSTVLVWTFASILSYYQGSDASFSTSSTRVPRHTLTTHRAPVTGLATGHSSHTSNFAVSISEDKSALVWHISTGSLLRTYLLLDIPRCIVLDPADRASYVGYQDGSIQVLDFFSSDALVNIADEHGLSAPIQADPQAKWSPPVPSSDSKSVVGAALCLAVSFDGARLLSGHQSGKVTTWDIGNGRYDGEICVLPGPVTNLQFLDPPEIPQAQKSSFKIATVMKPKIDSSNSADLAHAVFVGELVNDTSTIHLQPLGSQQTLAFGDDFKSALSTIGFSGELLWQGVNQLQEIQEQRQKKSASHGKTVTEADQNDDFIPLDAESEHDEKDDEQQSVAEDETDILKKQVQSLQNTQKESFKIMRELRKEREVLLRELEQLRSGT